MTECVGIAGVGLMGQAFSHHLLQAGFKVQGFDLEERRLPPPRSLCDHPSSGRRGAEAARARRHTSCAR